MEVKPITYKEIVDILDRKSLQKKYIIKTKYRSDDEEENTGFDKERYYQDTKRYGN